MGGVFLNTKNLRRLEIAGGAVVFLLASFLHFFYELTDGAVVGALFGAVNESLWEHIKIFSIAYLAWAIVELLWARPPFREFISAKAAGLLALWVGIALSFYIYTYFTGKPLLFVDLAIGIVFSVVSHFVSYRLTTSEKNKGQYFYTALMFLILAFIMILCMSYFPPKSHLFRDPVTGGYGVPPEALDAGAVFLDKTLG